jgi:hypothetical protein
MNNLVRFTKKFITGIKKLSRRRNSFIMGSRWGTFGSTFAVNPAFEDQMDKRIDSNPVDVVKQLIQPNIPLLYLENLDKAISVVNARIKIIKKNKLDFDEEKLALLYLKARKRFRKCPEILSPWPVVTEAAINDLLAKYKLCRVPINSYISTIPTEGLEEISKFRTAWGKLWVDSDEAEIILIVKESVAREVERKKDPIVLGKSPVGNWWHLIGAWDEEVKYVSDILYR